MTTNENALLEQGTGEAGNAYSSNQFVKNYSTNQNGHAARLGGV